MRPHQKCSISASRIRLEPAMDNAELQSEFPDWKKLEDTGAGDGLPTECERCGKSGTPRQQFEHMGVTICHLCASERAIELQAEGEWT